MVTKRFMANVRYQPEIAIIDLNGDINAFAEEGLNAAYDEATGNNQHNVLLNFKDVEYINSTGIALIVGLLAQARKSGRRIMTCGLSDHYAEIFQITRIADFMTIFEDEESALESVIKSETGK